MQILRGSSPLLFVLPPDPPPTAICTIPPSYPILYLNTEHQTLTRLDGLNTNRNPLPSGLTTLSRAVDEQGNSPHRNNQPFVGQSAFAHKVRRRGAAHRTCTSCAFHSAAERWLIVPCSADRHRAFALVPWREKGLFIHSQTRLLHANEGNPRTGKGTGP